MSIEAVEQLLDKQESYALLEQGTEDIINNHVIPAAEAFEKIEALLCE